MLFKFDRIEYSYTCALEISLNDVKNAILYSTDVYKDEYEEPILLDSI